MHTHIKCTLLFHSPTTARRFIDNKIQLCHSYSSLCLFSILLYPFFKVFFQICQRRLQRLQYAEILSLQTQCSYENMNDTNILYLNHDQHNTKRLYMPYPHLQDLFLFRYIISVQELSTFLLILRDIVEIQVIDCWPFVL